MGCGSAACELVARGVAEMRLGCALWAGGGLHTARPEVHAPGGPESLLPPDVLGHLTNHSRPQRPQELRMVVCEVPLSR